MNSSKSHNIGIIDVDLGHNVTIIQPVNLYGCTIGSDVFIGPFVEIQSGVEIGNRSKIQSHSFICSMVTIGADCFVGHGVMFVNDRCKLVLLIFIDYFTYIIK